MTTVPTHTPGKKPFTVAARLHEAIEEEWRTQKRFSPLAMPLTALAYTAIDQVDGHQDMMVEVMAAFVDTDTLTYRSQTPGLLQDRQKAQWDPLLQWISKEFGGIWHTTQGVMPIEQSESIHQAIAAYLRTLSNFELAATSLLASLCSSLILAIAVQKKRLSAQQAFELSRLEEDTQAEQWGVDPQAAQRAQKLQEEIVAAGRFLHLLETH
ncbi:MAG: ATP12 family protein [Rickettsiales bacterium]|nr:ATP12 family protein [Rickettsiales bacterium]